MICSPCQALSEPTEPYKRKNLQEAEASGKKPKRGKHSQGFRSSVYDNIPGNNTFPSEEISDKNTQFFLKDCELGVHETESKRTRKNFAEERCKLIPNEISTESLKPVEICF